MDYTHTNFQEYNLKKEWKILTVLDDMIADMLSNKKLYLIITELFIKGGNLSNCLDLITQSYFAVPKSIRINSTHSFIMKIPTNNSFSKLHLVVHQILIIKTL